MPFLILDLREDQKGTSHFCQLLNFLLDIFYPKQLHSNFEIPIVPFAVTLTIFAIMKKKIHFKINGLFYPHLGQMAKIAFMKARSEIGVDHNH